MSLLAALPSSMSWAFYRSGNVASFWPLHRAEDGWEGGSGGRGGELPPVSGVGWYNAPSRKFIYSEQELRIVLILILLRCNNRHRSRVKDCIWCSHEWGKLKTEGGTTPPLARKLPQRFADLFASPWWIFTQFNLRHNTITNCTIINIDRHNTLLRRI